MINLTEKEKLTNLFEKFDKLGFTKDEVIDALVYFYDKYKRGD